VSYFNNIETTVNYAQGGAQVVGAASSTPSPLMSAFMNPNMSYIDQTIPEQVNDAIKSKYFKRPDQAILFLIYGGADDYIKLAKGGQTGDKIFLETVDGCTSKAVEVANKLFTAAKTAQEALWGHARIGQVVVMGVPNLQAAPVFANIVEQTTDYVTMVNDTLKKNINSFNANHVSQEIIYFDAGLTETLLAGLLLETDAHYFTESVTEYNKYYFLGYEGKSLGSHEGGLNFSTPSFKKLTYNSWLSNQYLYKFYDFIHPSSSNSLLTALVFSYVINNTMGITEGSADADRIKAWKIGNKEMILKYLRNQYINPFCPEVLKTGPHGEFIDDYKYYRYYRVPPDIDISDAELASATVDNEGPL